MYRYLYKWYNYTEEDISMANTQVWFLENRIFEISSSYNKLTQEQKKEKIDKITLSINSIKYTYCL